MADAVLTTGLAGADLTLTHSHRRQQQDSAFLYSRLEDRATKARQKRERQADVVTEQGANAPDWQCSPRARHMRARCLPPAGAASAVRLRTFCPRFCAQVLEPDRMSQPDLSSLAGTLRRTQRRVAGRATTTRPAESM